MVVLELQMKTKSEQKPGGVTQCCYGGPNKGEYPNERYFRKLETYRGAGTWKQQMD